MATESIPNFPGPTKDKFGVPIGGSGSGILMPKLQYRFRVTLLNFGGMSDPQVMTQNVQTVSRPQLNHPEVTIDSYNSKVYVAGKHEWQAIEFAVRDDITNATTRVVGAQVQRQLNHFQQSAPAAGNDYKFDMQIETLDGSNNQTAGTGATEVFYLEGCFLTNVNYNTMDYANSESVLINMTVRYDNCTHYQGDNDLGGIAAGGNPFPAEASLNTPPSSIA